MKLIEGLRQHAKFSAYRFEETNLYSHSLTKGEVRERVVRDFLRPFLPACYGLGTGEVFSSEGNNSKQIDIVIYDAVFSTILRLDENSFLFPCESVFGSIEVKSDLGSQAVLKDAITNIQSLKSLKRDDSDILDFTPISRINVGEGLTYDKTKANPYLGIVFALDGMDGKTVCNHLIQHATKQRETLPDFVFNLKKQYMVSRWRGNLSGKNPVLNCRVGDYHGFMLVPLGDDILPTFYLVLNAMLNLTRLRQSNVMESLNSLVEGRKCSIGHWTT